MQLSELRTAVRTRIGNPSTDGFFSDTNLDDLINEALQSISTEEDWPWQQASTTFSTVVDQGNYTPPTDWVRTKALYILESDPMMLLSFSEIVRITHQGQPEFYTVYEEEIHLRPLPAQVETVQHAYTQSEPTLDDDADTPLMPARFHYSIVAYAAYLSHLRQARSDRARIELGAAEEWLQRMRSYRRRSADPIKRVVRPGGWI